MVYPKSSFPGIFGLFILVHLCGCASYQPHTEKDSIGISTDFNSNDSLKQSVYLIGDAGGATKNEPLEHFNALKSKLATEGPNATVIFLGDNIYQKGMPRKNDENRALAEHRINSQLDVVSKFNGRIVFIPGNHDYYSNGVKGVKRQADFIKRQTGKKNIFLPKNGCPIEKISLANDAVLLIIDTQWYLEDWDKSPGKNDDCDIKTREEFFEEFESLVKKNATKTTIVALHHPFYSSGPHGGQFKFSVLSAIPNLLRKTSGASVQDQQNSIFRDFKKRMVTLAKNGEKLIFVSGHEHLLQYIEKDGVTQIISGSGSKSSASRKVAGSSFSMSDLGYAKLDLYSNGILEVEYYKSSTNQDSLVYQRQIFGPDLKAFDNSYPQHFNPDTIASVYDWEDVKKGKAFTFLWGEHYREYFGTPIKVPMVSLDTLKGGLIPVRKGGGHQSNSLRLEDKNGKEYVMRALKKNAIRFMQSGIFKDQYIQGKYDDTYTEDMLMDVFTTAHPYAPLTVGPLLDAVDIYHPKTTLYYVPKQSALGTFNEDFGGELYFVEERAASGHGDKPHFGFSDELISSDDLYKKLRKSDDNILDEKTYLRARLMDILIGDWDRHKDQWRWAEFKEGKKTIYRPVPRDRDQAFSKYDGFLMEFTTRIIPAAKKLQVYDDEIRSIKWFNTNPFPVDKALINRSNLEDWLEQVKVIQEQITDEVIEDAFSRLPEEVQDETIDAIKSKFKGRLALLDETALDYHNYLEKYPVIKGTDKDNYFDIKRLDDGSTSIQIFNLKNGNISTKIFEKTYSPNLTKEIWIYGLDDKDVFKVSGKGSKYILLRLIGGQNRDSYLVENGRKVIIHDFKDKKSDLADAKGKIKLSNDYAANLYHHKKNKYSQNQLLPLIGFNPDDGFRLGINNIYTVFGFNRNPFSSQHGLKAHYYFATNGFDISYSYELANVIKKWNLFFQAGATSPNYSMNYYGLGNETINNEDELGDNFHRVKVSAYLAYPKLKWRGRMGAEIELGGLFEGLQIQNTEGRFINTIPDISEDRQYYLGAQGAYRYENYDYQAFPTLGMGFELEAGWKTNTNGVFDDLTFLKPSLSITHRLVSNGKLVLASKLKAHVTWGEEIEFYNLASIGGKDGLRGYRNQRFTGNRSFYQNTDLRYSIKEVKTGLLPLEMSVFGGFDYGRVWLDGESSNDWKTSYGGGFALIGADMINLTTSLFASNDGAYFIFGLGFDF